MKNIRLLSNDDLLAKTEHLVKVERETTNQILHLLLEIERRRIFSELGFKSLFEFCTQKLGYSESGAHRRIQSMRLLKSLGGEKAQKIEEKLEKGSLSLSVVAQVASFIQRESKVRPLKWDASQKEALLLSVEGHSSRETEKKLLEMASDETKQVSLERVRQVTPELTELRVALNSEILEMLEKIKGLIAHAHPNPSWSELIEILAKTTLQKLDPARPVRQKTTSAVQKPSTLEVNAAPMTAQIPHNGRHPIPAALKRQVWQRDHSECQYQDPKTGRKCQSRRFLEMDHLTPIAAGGKNELENLSLRCRYHNQWSAIQWLGQESMQKWIPGLRPEVF